MSFAEEFDLRWKRVLEPAVRRIALDGERLEPYRVNTRKISASVLTEILDGLTSCRLFIADISTVARHEYHSFRNGNVMYEVGLAHALRLPEEVLLFRSDDDPLLFDVANIRVNRYDPDVDASKAADAVVAAMTDAIAELDQTRSIAVRHAARSLDYPSWLVLSQAASTGPFSHPPTGTVGQVLGATVRGPAIARLLELGALVTSYALITPAMIEKGDEGGAERLLTHHATLFGVAILRYAAKEMGMFDPKVQALLEEMFRQEPSAPSGNTLERTREP